MLTSTLCYASLKFASQLKQIVTTALSRFSCHAEDWNIESLQIIYWFVQRISISYSVGVLLCNLVKPIVFFSVEDSSDIDQIDAQYTWAKSWTIVSLDIYLITMNT